ncbi:MAG: hypothetical protein KDK75_18770, partial [Alphaproteobacteria bacterium]|nr:hypothetical protein [Alphaproteobacteria bacterium]
FLQLHRTPLIPDILSALLLVERRAFVTTESTCHITIAALFKLVPDRIRESTQAALVSKLWELSDDDPFHSVDDRRIADGSR